MIFQAVILTGIFSIGYKKFQHEKQKHASQLLVKQKQQGRRLKSLNIKKSGKDAVASRKISIEKPKNLAAFSCALVLSSVGSWAYPPLYFLTPPLILYATHKKMFAAWYQVKKGKIDIETLSSLSIIGAIIGQHFFIGSLLGFINALGDYLASHVINDSQCQLVNFFQGIPENVWLLKDGIEISVPFSDVQPDDILVVSAGEIIPADGKIIWGVAGIDEHQFTGESVPAEKAAGDEVFAMTLVLSGKIHFKTEKAGTETSAMKILDILNHTADYKSTAVLEAQALSHQLVNPALLVSAITWRIFGFDSAVAVLFSHPKERMQVSAPISLMKYLKQSMDEGMLIKDGRSLELLYKVDTIVFDKTGTLTEDRPHIGAIHPYAEYDENEILYYAMTAEYKQTHPLAQAIFKEADLRGIDGCEPEHSDYQLGYGVKVISRGKTIVVGSPRFMLSEHIDIPERSKKLQENCHLLGHGLMMVGLDNQLIGAIELLPTIRPEAKTAIRALRQLKQIKKTYIISGDHELPTRNMADELGVDHYFAQTLPQQKAELIEELQQQGDFVCFIGDGINDTIAMKQAQVSISLAGASQLATDTAQILLLDQGIGHLPRLFELAQGFNRHMKRQFSIILGPSLFGVSMILLIGWGMSGMMLLNMAALTASLGYSLVDRPKRPPT